jgi:hypothetical protein
MVVFSRQNNGSTELPNCLLRLNIPLLAMRSIFGLSKVEGRKTFRRGSSDDEQNIWRFSFSPKKMSPTKSKIYGKK